MKQFSKFAVVGTIAFVIEWSAMTFLTEVFGVHYLISATIGFILSVTFNYFASMRYVFEHKDGMSRKREFAIFTILSVIGLGLNNIAMFALVDKVHIDYRIAKVLATMIVTLYNFFSRRRFLDAGYLA